MGPLIAIVGFFSLTFIVLKFIWDIAVARGKAQGYIEASEYFREQEIYLTEMADGYCEYLNREYERFKEQLTTNRRLH
jgi:hypothetical protein